MSITLITDGRRNESVLFHVLMWNHSCIALHIATSLFFHRHNETKETKGEKICLPQVSIIIVHVQNGMFIVLAVSV